MNRHILLFMMILCLMLLMTNILGSGQTGEEDDPMGLGEEGESSLAASSVAPEAGGAYPEFPPFGIVFIALIAVLAFIAVRKRI